MREIKFRGQSINGEWSEGNYNHVKKDLKTSKIKAGHYISNTVGMPFACLVRPETVGQFTGLQDNKERDIYEGDVVKFIAKTCSVLPKGYCQEPFKKGQLFVVKCLKSGFALTDPKILDSESPSQIGHVHNYDLWNHAKSLIIIGNKFDNPELLQS